jgi:hypothetical protein
MIELSEICATRHNNAQGPDGDSGTYCQIVDPLVTARNLKKQGESWDSIAGTLGVPRATLYAARKRGYFLR